MDDLTLDDAMDELTSAEDFLGYFGIAFDESVVNINRLHIMQRFHDYLSQSDNALAGHEDNEEARRAIYTQLLTQAYQDFVESDALTEKVFKVFRMHEPQTGFVPLESLL
ncbi:MAG: nitrogenase-stabilizing/protective protein NifW [Pseudomonas sp.]|uniref:nitrogenase-stabilizing/protective protein NifW n=1 Tax=Thalassolituus oleivorans TaxID=187493 RepID=UPI001A5CE21C|nr:nitrogenase-stabilizing/protective protein NifW [Thalassolituus oleivorans]MBL4832573.1 nitrogenase-stabilizing/protective protein NifW [Pseudomonas sp.]|tara:strand:- start:27313 stop:27642 length:330 start_codon:yes stop_codon:yes gene_type:complete